MDVAVKSEVFVKCEVFDDGSLTGVSDCHGDVKTEKKDAYENAAACGESSGFYIKSETSHPEFVNQGDEDVELQSLNEEIDIKEQFITATTEESTFQPNHVKFHSERENSSERQVKHEQFSGRDHRKEKAFDCNVCHKTFTRSSTLKRHIMIHTGEKPFACKICDKRFTLLSNLNSHMRCHTGEKPFECKMCNKKFTESYSLKRHERFHTGEKPYTCKICNKKFYLSGNLNSHMKIHSGEKPFACKMCNKEFNRSTTLKSHMRIHNGDKPFDCKVCHKKFIKLSTLSQHMKIHYREKTVYLQNM